MVVRICQWIGNGGKGSGLGECWRASLEVVFEWARKRFVDWDLGTIDGNEGRGLQTSYPINFLFIRITV